MTAEQSTRHPKAGEIWHPVDDPADTAIITSVQGNSVCWTSPADTNRDRHRDKQWATRLDDFTHYFIPPQETPASRQRPTAVDLSAGTRGEYNEWVIETKLGRRLAVCVDRSPYPEDARRELERLRAAHPGTVFRAIRETSTRTEEDW